MTVIEIKITKAVDLYGAVMRFNGIPSKGLGFVFLFTMITHFMNWYYNSTTGIFRHQYTDEVYGKILKNMRVH